MPKHLLLLTILFFTSPLRAQPSLMPVPASVTWGDQRFPLDKGFYVVLNDDPASRASIATQRFLHHLDQRTHLLIDKTPSNEPIPGKGINLHIHYRRAGQLTLHEDESYHLTITGDQASLEAETDLGVLHGLETFLQLVSHDENGYFLRGCVISDKPRFPWRGLLMDVCRHFMPVEVIKHNLDGMAMVKMNVLHLHLSDDQGVRIESKKFPKLHLSGSDGNFYSQEQIRDIIQYATARGIRVVPEFDMPGHATAWFAGHPELATLSGPYAVEKKFGVFDPTMDPTKKSTYKFLSKFITEMAALFPDEYFHIGGDENEGKHWDRSASVKTFKKKHEFKNNHELQNYFNIKLSTILKKNKKKMIGWDEILQPQLPGDVVIQSWRGPEGLKKAAKEGYTVILSNGYYIDLAQPAWKHYMNDPLPANTGLNPEEEQRILGGEATMWSEMVTYETVDSRIWPRTAAIAERLWSPREVNDVHDMYRRLQTASLQLESIGLQHLRNREVMIRRIAGHDDVDALAQLTNVVEPMKDYKRHHQGITYTTDHSFTRLPDIAAPESDEAREFRLLCERLIRKNDTTAIRPIEIMLDAWINNHDRVVMQAGTVPALQSWIRLSLSLREASLAAKESLSYLQRRNDITSQWTSETQALLNRAKLPVDEAELAVIDSIIMLFQHVLPK